MVEWNIFDVHVAAFFWLRRAYAGSTPKPAKHTIDFDHVTAKRRARFIGICHVTGESNRRTPGVRRISTKAWNRRGLFRLEMVRTTIFKHLYRVKFCK